MSLSSRSLGRRLGFCVVAAALIARMGGSKSVGAQDTGTDRPLTRERVQALASSRNSRSAAIPGEVLVKFRTGVSTTDRTRALSVMRVATQTPNRWIGDVLLVRSSDNTDPKELATLLQQQPEVEWAQPNYIRRRQSVPNDPDYSLQWNFDLINMSKAWDINPGASTATTIAVVDTGVTASSATASYKLWTGSGFETLSIPFDVSPDLSTSRILQGRDFTEVGGAVRDLDGHGTHVAGTILEDTNNRLALAGIAYRARLLPLKVCIGFWDMQILMGRTDEPGYVDSDFSACEDADVADAILYAADSGANVINLSIGGDEPAPLLLAAIRYAVGRGTFVAIAGGNAYEDGNPPSYPAAYAADIDGAMAVGAVGPSSRRAYYSNTGSYIEIVAPGGDYANAGELGLIYQATLCLSDYDPATVVRPRFDGYCEMAYQGTSMASPHVAGVAGLLYSQGITSPSAIEAAMKTFAHDLGAAGRDVEYGYGLLDARAALYGLGVAR